MSGFRSLVTLHQRRNEKRGMEYICETKDYNVAEFHERFQDKLPLVVKVVQGYCGEIASDVFDKDQVIRLQAVASQRRVISKFKQATYQDRLFSIPSTLFEKICVVNKWGKAGEEKFMFEVLRGFSLPRTVRFPKNRHITVGNSSVNSNNIPDIELIQIFEEVSILGNFINDGEMSTDLIHVPLYLSHLRLAVITGIKGYSPSKWKQFIEELETTSTYVEYDLQFGNPEIAEYDPNAIHSDATYTYVEPRIYSNIVHIMQRPVVHSLPADEAKQTTQVEHKQHIAQAIDQEHGDVTDVYEEIQAYSNVTTPKATTTELQSKQQAGLRTVNPQTHKAAQHHKTVPIIPPKPKQTSAPVKLNEPPALPKRNANVRASTQHENVSNNYSNDVPRTQVKPTVHNKQNSLQSPQLSTETPKQERDQAVKSTSIPNVSNCDDVSKLTIDEVVGYLKKLGLGQYEKTFREQMVDGVLLVELDRDMLRDDFGMKGIEALRLTRFAKDGHVPM